MVFSGRCLSAYDPIAMIMADTYRITNGHTVAINTYLNRLENGPHKYQWHDAENDNTDPKDQLITKLTSPQFVDAGYISQRQINQSGRFILFPNKIVMNNMINVIQPVSKEEPPVVLRIKVAGRAKERVIKELAKVGITREFLFPDNIDSLNGRFMDELKNRFQV